MNEAQMMELLGRKQVALERAIADYSIAVEILRGLKDGTFNIERLTIHENGNLTIKPAVAAEDAK